jgi:hypothetical protein
MKERVAWLSGLVVAVLGLQAQTYSIDWSTIDGGGGRSVGGGYILEGTIGQPDAGPVLTGGGYELRGGFWPGLIVVGPGHAPRLFIQVVGGEVQVFWAPETPGIMLEMTDDLTHGEWIPGPLGNPVVVGPEVESRFYRLRRVD